MLSLNILEQAQGGVLINRFRRHHFHNSIIGDIVDGVDLMLSMGTLRTLDYWVTKEK